MLPRTHLRGHYKTRLVRSTGVCSLVSIFVFVRLQVNLHVQCTLGLGCFLPAAVANQSTALGQAKVESQQGAVLHANSPQCGAINLQEKNNG